MDSKLRDSFIKTGITKLLSPEVEKQYFVVVAGPDMVKLIAADTRQQLLKRVREWAEELDEDVTKELNREAAIDSLKESWWEHLSEEEQEKQIDEWLYYMLDCNPEMLERMEGS
ncbi:MAG: hypothetical protein SWK76_17135 [Actinomycetota bacterium]|nr:hypothetical protein [Actinomycetota bacterium]